METYKRIRDVFTVVEDFHREAEQLLSSLKEKSDRKRVRLFFDFLSRHERRYAEVLSEYRENEAEKINETRIQFVPHAEYLHLEKLNISPNMSIDEIVNVAMELDDRLIQFFYAVVNGTMLPPNVKNVFNHMIEQEAAEKKQVVQTAEKITDAVARRFYSDAEQLELKLPDTVPRATTSVERNLKDTERFSSYHPLA